MSTNGKNPEQKYPRGVKFCRGTAGGPHGVSCPHSLVNGQPDIEALGRAVTEAIAAQAAQQRKPAWGSVCKNGILHTLRFAMAACPNACTEPQTKDVGIIAIQVPTGVGPGCDGCGRCEVVCREDAIKVFDGRAQIVPDRCVGCGQCIHECPNEAISSEPVRFRVLVGGRMGRHPRWAEQLCVVDGPDVVNVIQSFFEEVRRHAGPGERTANVTERIGIATLKEKMSVNVL